MRPDYLLIGQLTSDLLPDGSTAPGGTALYSALTAHRLGRQVGIVSAPAPLPDAWPTAIALAPLPATPPPIFENRYVGGARTQILHADAAPLRFEAIPESWREAPIVHLGPILHEVSEDLVHAFPNALIGITPQGWMRSWDTTLPSAVRFTPWRPAPSLLARIDALVLSIEDVHGDAALVATYAEHCRLVALTYGADGLTLFLNGTPTHVAAKPAVERDPTGAGDVFAATLFSALQTGAEPLAAAHLAAKVAAASVSALGASGLLTMELN